MSAAVTLVELEHWVMRYGSQTRRVRCVADGQVERECGACGEWLPLEAFSWSRNAEGRPRAYPVCHACVAVREFQARRRVRCTGDQWCPWSPDLTIGREGQPVAREQRVCDWCHAVYDAGNCRWQRFCGRACGEARRHRNAARRRAAAALQAYWDEQRFPAAAPTRAAREAAGAAA